MKIVRPFFWPSYRAAGEYTLYADCKEIRPKFTNTFILNYDLAIRCSTRKIPKGIYIVVPGSTTEQSYSITISNYQGRTFAVSVNFSEALMSELAKKQLLNKFIELTSDASFIKVLKYRRRKEVPGGICYNYKTDSIRALLENAGHVVSELIQSLFKES